MANPDFSPIHISLMKITLADRVSTDVVSLEDLTVNWRENFEESGFIGDSWLASGSSALLGVPSAPSPECTNYLLNPLHPDSRGMTIEWCKWIQYNKRLFRV
jgi:RES domain-containing protein